MYLVILRHSIDDLPLAIFIHRNDAFDYAAKVEHGDQDCERICNLLSLDSSTPLNVSVIQFAPNQDMILGKFVPIKFDVLKDLERSSV